MYYVSYLSRYLTSICSCVFLGKQLWQTHIQTHSHNGRMSEIGNFLTKHLSMMSVLSFNKITSTKA